MNRIWSGLAAAVVVMVVGVAAAAPKAPAKAATPAAAPATEPAQPKPPMKHADGATAEGQSMLCPIIFGLIIAGFVAVQVSKSNAKAARLKAYNSALAALAQNPGDNTLRANALAAGRRHYGGLRKGGAPTIYDESAIGNDINARLGGGPKSA